MKSVAIVGSGPAALMVADRISSTEEFQVQVFEKKKGPGRKLLIAGSSGLNITNSLEKTEFLKHYSGSPLNWEKLLDDFPPSAWIQFIEDLKLATFEGTSGRYFVKEMKASKLLRAWLDRLIERKVEFSYNHELTDFTMMGGEKVGLTFQKNLDQQITFSFDAVCFCLGGGSYETQEKPLRWPEIFKNHRLDFHEFTPSNVGYQVDWTPEFLKEAEGLPLKNISLSSSRGIRKGDMVITRYGFEGTPVYFVGRTELVRIDLKPDLSVDQMMAKCREVRENLSPLRRVKKQLSLGPASLALLFHHCPREVQLDLRQLCTWIKAFPIQFKQSQDLDEAISSAGGLNTEELNEKMMLKKFPGIFAAGEMLSWDAPTGGFLIQACVSQGNWVGRSIGEYLRLSTALE